MQQTLVVIKPDAVQRRLVGRIVQRFEEKGLRIAAMRMMRVEENLARDMYSIHEGKDFYEPLVTFITASPVVAMVVEGRQAIQVVRGLMGPTFGRDAPPGTIRGDFGQSRRYNLIHGSDSPTSAQREIPLFFPPESILEYAIATEEWVYAENENPEK